MRKKIVLLFFLSLTLTLTAQPKHEVRAVWLATIGGIDWPRTYAHDGMGISVQQHQLRDMLDRLKAAGVNTVLLQTRIRATTIFPSDKEPWDGCLSGTPGVSPGYDALQFAIDECHSRGMELHAWVVTVPVGKWKSYGCQQLRRRYGRLIMKFGDEGYMNPESEVTAEYISDMCEEITRRYDVDGIHLDYIRYPESWRGRKDPEHITRIVRYIYNKVKGLKPWVKLSCSPVGKYSDLSRYRAGGWNARDRVAQHAQEWLAEGLMDQLYPMQYFKGSQYYPFAIDWQEHSHGRTVVSGLGTYLLHPREGDWPLEEMERQMSVSRQIGLGHCYFRAKFLLDNVKGAYDFACRFDRYPALVPAMTWWHSTPPQAPTALHVEHGPQGDMLTWSGAQDRSDAPYLLYNVYASPVYPVDVADPACLVATRLPVTRVSVPYAAALSQPRYYAVTAMDRYGNESPAVRQPVTPAAAESAMLPNDGLTLTVPDGVTAQYLAVRTLQGSIVRTMGNSRLLDIRVLPDGIYELRSLHRKGITHRVGFFIVRR